MPVDSLQLTVAVPDRQVLDESVGAVRLPLTTGYIGILPGHAPLLAEVGTGVLSFSTSIEEMHMAIDGGAVEVLPDRVRVLAERAERAEQIDEGRARGALERAERRLVHLAPDTDVDRAQRALARARARRDALGND